MKISHWRKYSGEFMFELVEGGYEHQFSIESPRLGNTRAIVELKTTDLIALREFIDEVLTDMEKGITSLKGDD